MPNFQKINQKKDKATSSSSTKGDHGLKRKRSPISDDDKSESVPSPSERIDKIDFDIDCEEELDVKYELMDFDSTEAGPSAALPGRLTIPLHLQRS